MGRLGDRWPMRREQVYDHVERSLQRHLAGEGYWQRVSERDYLIVQPGATRFGAQAFCLGCLRELLKHFLGETRESDLQVCEVTRLSPSGLSAAPVDALAVEAAAAREAASARAAEPPSIGPASNWTPFVATDGRPMRVSCTLEPVFQLKTHARIGYRMARRVVQTGGAERELSDAERQALSRSDIERVDLATIARGLGRLTAEAHKPLQPSLILPVSYVSLSNLKSRALLATAFKEAQTRVRQGVICEAVDIEGVPPGALLAAISMIKPFCLFVVGHVHDPSDKALRELGGSHLQGISFDCPAGLDDDADFLDWARTAIGGAKRITKSVLVYRLSSPRRAAMAGVLGASHASLNLVSTPVDSQAA
jgi:hypothetical protein